MTTRNLSRPLRMVGLASIVLSAVALAACSEETIAPAPVDGASPSGTGGAGTGGGSVSPPGDKIRTVETRNPWGGSLGNLLVDGDFEFSVVLQGSQPQAGWRSFDNFGPSYVRGETGGLCKSGLRCARVGPGQFLFGQGTAARGVGMIAGLWAKPPEGSDCEALSYTIIRCNFSGSLAVDIPPVSLTPDAEGWCRYQGGVDEQQSATCAFIESSLPPGTTAIVDAATLLPADGTAPLRSMTRMTGARAARTRAIVDTIRERRPIGDPPKRELPIGHK